MEKYIKFCIGRKNTAAIELTENSVSNEHAFLYVYDKNIFILDEGSKFGSLKRVPAITKINPKKSYIVNNFKIQIHFLKNKTRCTCKKRISNFSSNPIVDVSNFLDSFQGKHEITKPIDQEKTKRLLTEIPEENVLEELNLDDGSSQQFSEAFDESFPGNS